MSHLLVMKLARVAIYNPILSFRVELQFPDLSLTVSDVQLSLVHPRGHEEKSVRPDLHIQHPHFDVERVQHHLPPIRVLPYNQSLVCAPADHQPRRVSYLSSEGDVSDGATMPCERLSQDCLPLVLKDIPQLDGAVCGSCIQVVCLGLHLQHGDMRLVEHVGHLRASLVVSLRPPWLDRFHPVAAQVLSLEHRPLLPPYVDGARGMPADQGAPVWLVLELQAQHGCEAGMLTPAMILLPWS
mmetsp:Transcript_27496/g.89568  ORF Transcript_27496/g.89568 Transcript_27496/m.89568 type:complete len:241 (-) Transcript_27496:158-880(-)